MNKHLILTLLLLFGSLASGQTFTLSGRILEEGSREPMPFVNVALLRPSDSVFMRGATTDDAGHYAIRDVAAGSYILKVAFMGCEPYWQSIEVKQSAELAPIALKASVTTLEGVTITAERPIFSMDGEKNIYSTADDPSAQSGTAADALRSAPGVEVDHEGNITLRGVSSVAIWVNGQPSHLNAEALKQYIKTLPASAIERIEVITNPSARYKTTGGVINIVTNSRVQRNDFVSLEFEANSSPTLAPWVSYVHSNERLTLNVYGGVMYVNDPSTGETAYEMRDDDSLLVERYDKRNSTLEHRLESFYGLDLDYRFDDANSISLWLGGWCDVQRNELRDSVERTFFPQPAMLYTDSLANRNRSLGGFGGLWYTHEFEDEGHVFSASLSADLWNKRQTAHSLRTYQMPQRAGYQYDKRFFNREDCLTFEANYSRPFGKRHTLDLGGEYLHDWGGTRQDWDTVVDFSTLSTAVDSLRTFADRTGGHYLALYATYQLRLGGFTAKAGLRTEDILVSRTCLDSTLSHQYHHLIPSLHFTYRTKNQDNFKINYTLRFDAPEEEQLVHYRRYDLESFTVGTPDLRSAYMHNLEAGWTRFLPRLGSVSAELFYRANTDEIQTLTDGIYDPALGRYVQFSRPVNMGSSSLLGGQLNLTYRPNATLSVRLDGTLFESRYRAQFREGQWVEGDTLSYRLRLSAWVKLWKKVDLFCNASYASPTIGLLSATGPRKSIDLGLAADLLAHKLSLTLGVQDLFNWNAHETSILNPYLTSSATTLLTSRYLTFSLTYRLGRMDLADQAKGKTTR